MSKLSNAEYQLHVSHDSAKSAHGLSTTGTPPPRMLKYMDFGMDELCLIYSGETTLLSDRPSLAQVITMGQFCRAKIKQTTSGKL